MRIALLTNFWYVRGGLERVVLADAHGLEERGHQVLPFASAHALNDEAATSRFFPPNVDHAALGRGLGPIERARTAVQVVHNRQAAKAFGMFVDSVQPDVVHQHGLARQFSPSVLETASSRGLPTVLTLHDYGLRCPSALLSRPGARECLDVSCAGHRYDRAVRFKCVHGSRAASALAAAELLVARALRRYERAVDLFLVPSEYLAQRMLESGVPSGRLRVMPNSIEPGAETAPADDGYVFTFGRLVDYKGFGTVVEVARSRPGTRFLIAGDGPGRADLEAQADGLENVQFLGFVSQEGISDLIRGARLVVVPSEWPEPFGMVVLETWREGRPVVVARTGALPELVEDGRDGYVYERGDAEGAGKAVDRLIADSDLANRMGAAGRARTDSTYSIDAHLDRLEATYKEVAA